MISRCFGLNFILLQILAERSSNSKLSEKNNSSSKPEGKTNRS